MRRSSSEKFTFHLFSELNRVEQIRSGETKMNQTVLFGPQSRDAQYLILGISENIGPQMNGGFSGSNMGFASFVRAFQAIQHNTYSPTGTIGFLGEITQNVIFQSIDKSLGWVEELDDFVLEILDEYGSLDQKLIVIGGGHNNAYPILKHINIKRNKKIHAINIDPHADCRSLEYRHSGNPFSMAEHQGIIEQYAAWGLHESYNNTYILDYLAKKQFTFQTFEDYIDRPKKWRKEMKQYLSQCNPASLYTLDIDIDAIAFAPSSALTPSGFSIEEIRKWIRIIGQNLDLASFHLPEGAPQSEKEKRLYGKMISYFVMDFIKSQEMRHIKENL